MVRFLRAGGFPHAERRTLKGNLDQGDITGTPGICWEVKGGNAARNASDLLIDQWLAETEAERVNARADIGVLVVQRAGIGPANAGRWWAIVPAGFFHGTTTGPACRLHLTALVHLLRQAGYGEPFIDDLEGTA